MSTLLKKLLGGVYMARADDGEAGGAGGAVDRGDAVPADNKVEELDPTDPEGTPEDEDEDEAEDEDDEAAIKAKADEEEAAKPAVKTAKETKMLPKARFDEQRMKSKERETALMDRIKALEAGATRDVQAQDVTKLEGEIKTLEETYQKALDDGEKGPALEAMRAIRLKERQISEASVEHKTDRARALAVEEFKVDMLIERMEQDFPALNPQDDAYDQEVVDEVVLLRTGFERSGMSSSAAITKAIKYVMGAAAKAADVELDAEPDTKEKGLGADKKDARRKAQLAKNLDASTKQPAKLTDAGLDSHKKGGSASTATASQMSDEEYAALPESARSRMRGDFGEDIAA